MSKEAMKLALEGAANYIDALGGDSRKYRQALANEALDKKAENARELGLDYEPAQQQEPVAYGVLDEDGQIDWTCEYPFTDDPGWPDSVPLYTSPPAQRTWVGLTDEEISARAANFYNPEMYKRAALWAQEKLKERNQ